MEQAKRAFSRLGWCYVAGTILMNILREVVFSIVGKVRPEWIQNTDRNILLSSVIVYGFTLPFIYLLARSMPKKVPEKKPVKVSCFLGFFLMGYAMIFVCNIVGNIATMIIGLAKGSQVDNRLLEYVTTGNAGTMLIAMVLLAPIMEEMVFRKLLVDRVLQYGEGMAVVLSGLMFGLFHGNLNQFAYAVVLGAFFAYIYIRTGDIRITIGLHMMINFLGSVVASGLVKMVHYTELLEAVGNTDRMVELVKQYSVGWLLYGLYLVFVMIVVIAGIVLMILRRKEFRLESGDVEIPADQTLQTLLGNPGMLFFCAMWIVLIISQLLA